MTTTMATGDLKCFVSYTAYFRGRKSAFKTKVVPGTIILKKKKAATSDHGGGDFSDTYTPKSVSDDDASFISRKRNWELFSQDLELDPSLLGFDSVTLAEANCAEKRRRIGESIAQRCRRAGVIRGCGSSDEYERYQCINRGAYGEVFVAVDRRNGKMVAVKEEFEGVSVPTLREIDILKSLPPHPSIVGFMEAITDAAGKVYVVMEHVEYDLRKYMKSMPEWDEREMKKLMKQLLEGVQFLHQNKVMHRDLKPGNILVSLRGKLKICDFGLSRRMGAAGARYSPEVGTPGYRAPEMLRGEKAYSTAVDMWGVGCVMAEMMLKRPLFRVQTTSDWAQLEAINWILGPNGDNLRKNIISSEAGFDLLSSLLCCDPSNRITAQSALNHVWFKD